MSFEYLEIFRLGQNGEVIRKIRCLGRRVTVFRALKNEDLEAFKKALEGKPQEEKFSLLVDGKAYQPEKFSFIGFPDRTGYPPQATASHYLQACGMSLEEIEGTLLKYGLGGCGQSKLSELPNWKRKALLILGAVSTKYPIIIADEPFEEMPEEIRDALAQLFADYVWKSHAIVIVTKLSFRPECWIENDIIVRAQLERPRQRTIGFGGGGDAAVQEALDAVRGRKNTEKRPLTAVNSSKLSIPNISQRAAAIITCCSLAVSGVLLWAIFTKTSNQPNDSISIHASQQATVVVVGENSAPLAPEQVGSKISEPIKKSNFKHVYLIDGYPEEVRNAWLASFNPQKQAAPQEVYEEEAAQKQEPAWASPQETKPNIRALYDELNVG